MRHLRPTNDNLLFHYDIITDEDLINYVKVRI